MYRLVATYRIIALCLWFAFAGLLSLPFQFMDSWRGRRTISRITRLWSRGVARILNLHIKISGPVPEVSGGLVISNHLGYLDIITHGCVFPLRFCSRKEIRTWPVMGWYLSLSQPIWADRESKQKAVETLGEFRETMDNGMYLIVYPEGTSTDGKHGILPFKSTSFAAAASGNHAIIPILTRYNEPPGTPTVCWYGDMEFLPHAREVVKRPYIEVELRFHPPIHPGGRTRKELASLLHDTMEREYRTWKRLKHECL